MAKKRTVLWRNASPELKARLGKAVLTLARFCHREDEIGNFRIELPRGRIEDDAVLEVGPLVALEYKVGKETGPGKPKGIYRHLAGDTGRGKKRTRAPMVCVNLNGRPVIIPRRGSRLTFGARGLSG